MGLYDIPANVKEIKSRTNFDKINYIGFSQGTSQMFYGLAHLEESFYAANVNRFVAFGPCT